jgi:hypothetical protein
VTKIAFFAALLLLPAGAGLAQSQPPQTPPTTRQDSSPRHDDMTTRGDHAMGFSHDTTTHHFLLYKTGGSIEVLSNDPKAAATRDQIRMHLAHIAKSFSDGNFNVPMFIHATNPPGADTLARLRSQIRYQYQQTDRGARIRISSSNPEALAALHAFLRFQISEHQTGDSTEVQ